MKESNRAKIHQISLRYSKTFKLAPKDILFSHFTTYEISYPESFLKLLCCVHCVLVVGVVGSTSIADVIATGA